MTDLAIDVRALCKRFGARRVVDGLSLAVPAGQICGFLGGNGSGKTTTIRLLCGLLTADEGEGQCLGFDLMSQAAQIRLQVGYMTQKFSFYGDLTVRENLDFVARLYQLPDRAQKIRDIIDRMAFRGREDQLARELSGGWKQRLALAACVLHKPKLLLLDEPTAGVDAKARREFWDLIGDMAQNGMTVLVSTHYMDEAERCHRVIYLSGGKIIVEGAPEQVVRDARLFAFEAFGADLGALVIRARATKDIANATIIGRNLRVVGTDRDSLAAAIKTLNDANVTWREVAPRLDDVFIHLLSDEG